MVISKPISGWTKFNFGGVDFSASYITEVPIDILDGAIEYVKYNKSVCVDFDAEGSGTWKLIISEYECYVICDDEFPRIYSSTENGDEIVKDILKYIEMYFEDWVDWLCFDEYDKTDGIYNDILSDKLYILKALINKDPRLCNYKAISKKEILDAIDNFYTPNVFQTCKVCPCNKFCHTKYKEKPDYMNCCDIFKEWLQEEYVYGN